MSSYKCCKACGEKILHVNPYCTECKNVDIYKFGHYTTGLSSKEIEQYLGQRANTLSTKNLLKKFSKIAGINTVGVHQCESCGHQISLMYRYDVFRFAEKLFNGTSTYWD